MAEQPVPFAAVAGPHSASLVAIGEAWGWGDPRIPARIWEKISPEPNTGCWLWTGYVQEWKDGDGYEQTWFDGKLLRPHVVMYKYFKGEIPSGLDLDHLCRVRCCCNPDHLEPVSRSENNKRGTVGQNMKDLWAKAEKCQRGHLRTPDNIIVNKGYKLCKACRNARTRWYRAGKPGNFEDWV